MIANLMDRLGPGVKLTYLAEEDDGWWCELALPFDRYEMAVVTAAGVDADEAFENVVKRALGYRREARAA